LQKRKRHDCEPNRVSDDIAADDECERETEPAPVHASVESEDDDHTLSQLVSLLPTVMSALTEAGHGDIFMTCCDLTASRRLPLDNIAVLLFNDVVQWFTLDNSSQMRYSDVVKKLWRLGNKFLKGKFLRFMSGMKKHWTCGRGYVCKGSI
jgi:hypothetical protein